MPPLIRRPRGLTGFQLGLGVSIGVLGGIYIWKPVVDKYFKDRTFGSKLPLGDQDKAHQLKEEAEQTKDSSKV